MEKLSKKKSVLILILLTIIGIVLIFTQYFGLFPLEDQYALDMLNYYSKTQFFDNIEAMDKSNRLSYFMIHIGDYLFMTGFYQLLAVAIYKILHNNSKIVYLILVPYLAFIFDFLENLMMDIHLMLYPKQIDIFGYIAGVSTFIKFTTLYSSITIIVLAIIYRFITKHKKTTYKK